MIERPTQAEIVQVNERPDLATLGQSDQQKLNAALRDGWRLTPATLAHKITEGRWIAARHLLYISTIVATEVAKGGARIILTMPFRHGKSEFLSINTPIWFLEKWPGKYVMSISYGSELITDFSLRVRDTFLNEDLHHLLKTRLNRKKLRVDRFLTTAGGGLTAAGIGGPLTGRGADLMLIDDYIKGVEEALSPAGHKKIYEWFRSTAYPRLEPGASLIILATRWDYHDLIARVLQDLPHENWTLINLPMRAEVNDPLGRELHEPLWPERYSAEACDRIEKTLGPYWFAAECQQNPKESMSGADLGHKFKTIAESDMPQDIDLKTVRAWDLAATEGGGDYTAGIKMSRHRTNGRIYIRDVQRDKLSPDGCKKRVNSCAINDGHGVKIWMEQEPGSSGKTVILDYKKMLKAYNFDGEKATGPIEVRAGPYTANIETGNVYLVRADWNDDFKSEHNGFPDGLHDDQIIASALAYNKLLFGVTGALTWGRDAVDMTNVVPIRGRERLPENKDKPLRRLTW